MSDDQRPVLGGKSFEDRKQTNEHGAEFWSARDLQPLLGYDQWRNFEGAVKKARTSCEQSGNITEHHFAGASKMIEIGKGGVRNVPDYHLSRFACYLIAQNGDPRKPEIARAKRYFAIQAWRRAMSDLLDDAGYKGMYGGLGRDAIKRRKEIPDKENLMDRMDSTELAANQFRMTQARDKLARDGVRTEARAIQTHEQVGKEVREAIRRIGGTLPESIPPAEPIKDVEKRLKKAKPRLVLDGPEAQGLLGEAVARDGDDDRG